MQTPVRCWVDCVETPYAKDGDGYGHRKVNGRYEKTHRLVWVEVYGEIPDGMCVLHRCDNPPCVNPGHLFLGTLSDNAQDMAAKGRQWQQLKTHCAQGHEYTEENTYRPPNHPLWRQCRTCNRERRYDQ